MKKRLTFYQYAHCGLVAMLLLGALEAVAQTISGTVYDPKTKEKLPFVSVFFNNSAIATETDSLGKYKISQVPAGNYLLIVRLIGYKVFTKSLSINPTSALAIDVPLEADETFLNEVRVTAKRDKSWAKHFQTFEKEFLGASQGGRIVNPQVLRFEYAEGVLQAQADDRLLIDNQAIGYKIDYDLRYFKYDGTNVNFAGYAQFTPYYTPDAAQKQNWENRRKDLYLGSDTHFFRVLQAKKAKEQGFEAFVDKPGEDPSKRNPFFYQQQAKKLTAVDLDALIQEDPLSGQYVLPVNRRIEIHYNDRQGAFSIYKDKPCQVAWIETNGQPLRLNKNGLLLNPQAVSLSGYLVQNRVASLLPLDYQPAFSETKPAPSTQKNWAEWQEKPIFATDRSYYFRKDLIQVSGMMHYLNPAKADSLSEVVHIELLNPINKSMVVSQLIPVVEGKFSAQIPLSDSIKTGQHYLLRAYTRWMLNFGDSTYSYQWIPLLERTQALRQAQPSESAVPWRVAVSDSVVQLNLNRTDLRWATLSVSQQQGEGLKSVSFGQTAPAFQYRYSVEKSITLAGQVLKPRLPTGTMMTLLEPNEQLMRMVVVEPDGRFRFENLPMTEAKTIFLKWTNIKTKDLAKIEIKYEGSPQPSWIPTSPASIEIANATESRSDWPNEGINLNEVTVKDTKPSLQILAARTLYREPDYVVEGKELFDKSVGFNILTALQGRVPGLTVVETRDAEGVLKVIITMRLGGVAGGLTRKPMPQPLVLVDGVVFENINQLASIPVNSVERIEVVNRAESFTGARGYVGVISIITKSDFKPKSPPTLSKDFLTAQVQGWSLAPSQNQSKLVHWWIPHLSSGAYLTFPKPAKNGKYWMQLKGISDTGEFVVQNQALEIR
ncbi:MAG: TonB-dependent receptor [Spirosomaceae bacterium]|nr:TonB-dependent receptor [Spirosomataceae bacterium]